MATHSMLHPTPPLSFPCCCCGCSNPSPPPVLLLTVEENTAAEKSCVSGDEDSFVEEVLNLKNGEDGFVGMGLEFDLNVMPCSSPPPPPSTTTKKAVAENRGDENNDDLGSVLAVPADEADLEWLSQFVEDSFSHHFTLPYTTGPKPFAFGPGPVAQGPDPERPVLVKSKRSKRTRTGVQVWSSSLTDSTTTAASVSSCSSSSPPPPNFPAGPKRSVMENAGGGGIGRKCSHCGVQKTPQWREGPNGPKTLCNACGVRYKSGRLLPEYRPASSPTFSRKLHSNSHRKVMEMRRKKEKQTVIIVMID